MQTQKTFNKNVLYLHIAVMLFGLSGVTARFVEVPAVLVAFGSNVINLRLTVCVPE